MAPMDFSQRKGSEKWGYLKLLSLNGEHYFQ